MVRCAGKASHGNRATVIGGIEQMRLYETIFIIQPELSEEDAEGHIKRVENLITRLGGEILKTERWGKKRLAYEINKQRYGYYVLLRLRGEPAILPELERHYRLTEGIIRSMVISLKAEPKEEPVLVASEGQGEEEEHPLQEDEEDEEGR
jgi:small subunit ribosomal protein S6